jgi:stage II sporulation protein AB (anti-sigma F factor)
VKKKNFLQLEIPSKSENESLARVVVAALAAQLDPTIDELNDVKTAVSEAVTNAVIHGYEGREGIIVIKAELYDSELVVEVEDRGVGIKNLEQAREPLFTTRPAEERSGMGFTIMENFMDRVDVITEEKVGTRVIMRRKFRSVAPAGE